ncbi:MAG: outer membrane lipid asymmetry maintenance protein MlaD [Pseudomonadales bacterium]|nr:outer membrane lipid asymmetry maintenance protein MlaD [Pseudomonadales bacterium]
MRLRTVEISVGAFVLAGALALIFLAVKVSGVSLVTEKGSYIVKARFDDVAGLRPRAKVSMAGVTIGRIADIVVDMQYGEAIVSMEIDGAPGRLSADTGAQIFTEGILGARYVSLAPGADEETLGDGDFITDTQGALVLEKLVGDLVTRLGASE